MSSKIIWHKGYSGESIVDISRDVDECLNGEYNDAIAQLPVDDHGFVKGEFVVTVTWVDEPKCCVCGTTENLHKDGWYGHRCDSVDCMVF